MFSHLITFHDPELSNHLEGIGFIPDVRLIICFVTIILLHALQSIIIIWHIVLFHVSSVNRSLYHKQYYVSSCKFVNCDSILFLFSAVCYSLVSDHVCTYVSYIEANNDYKNQDSHMYVHEFSVHVLVYSTENRVCSQ